MTEVSANTPLSSGSKDRWFAVFVTVIVSAILTLWGIYGFGQYGIALFIFTPLFIGAGSTILYGLKQNITQQNAYLTAFLTLGIYTLFLFFFAIEGIICIAMAAPFGFVLTWAGSLIGYAIIKKARSKSTIVFLLLVGVIPTMSFIEKDGEPTLRSVVTSIEINASPQTVWKNVIEFPQLDEPTELIFKAGIAYPINAKIEGTGIGAIRHCNFTTGSFVEPITAWNEPQLLAFDVAQQPASMKELSFWDIDAPHLHDYFVSKKGQFKLKELPNGNTLLEGTTWYYHHISPDFYWQLWSDHIIHKIHDRVLVHIKKIAEAENTKHVRNARNTEILSRRSQPAN